MLLFLFAFAILPMEDLVVIFFGPFSEDENLNIDDHKQKLAEVKFI